MAALAEHLFSGPPVAVAPAPPAMSLAPIGIFCASLTLFVVSCSVLAYSRVAPRRR
jgi:hypothetical protein